MSGEAAAAKTGRAHEPQAKPLRDSILHTGPDGLDHRYGVVNGVS